MPAGLLRSGTARTAILSAALAAVAIAISALWIAAHGAGAGTAEPITAALLAVAFFVAERNLVTFEFRRQSHSMTFAGVPLALGILVLPVPMIVVSRVVGSLAAMIAQRTSAEKVCYNISAFAFEAAATATLCRQLVPDLAPASVVILIACVAAVDQLMTALVLVVIRLHGITMQRGDVLQVVGQSLALSAIATSFAITLRILLLRGVTGYSLAIVLVATAVLGYRMYAATVRRHHAVTTVHDFVTGGGTPTSPPDLAGESLMRVRSVVRAGVAELAVLDTRLDAAVPTWTVYRVDEDDRLSVTSGSPPASDWIRMRALHNGIATLAVRGSDPDIDAWLDTAGPQASRLDDAIVVPVRSGTSPLGTLTVSGRLSDIAVFTSEDLQVLQTVGGHLAASMQSAKLLETLRYDATHDALTGLTNRTQLITELAALTSADAAVLVIDLDHFKDVNDVLGHEVADELLVVVAQRLQRVMPTVRTLARVGGDEFAILLTGADVQGDLSARAQRLVGEIAEPLNLHGTTVGVSVSIGVATTAAVATGDLLRCADTAMYIAKARTDRVAVYSPAMDLGRAERVALAADLRLALEHAPEQLAIFLQPKVDLHTGRPSGAEALVRWNHPTHGLIGPDRFIPIAEATGLIVPLTRLVLHQALVECAAWDARATHVSVNLSARLLADVDVASVVEHELAATGVVAGRLVLEVTESVIMNDTEVAIDALRRIADLGVRISLDDFGTGFSSLSYLQRLPASELKIDKSFVAAADADGGQTSALLRNIVALGRDLGLEVVAEGIETQVQAGMLAALGCTVGQGYLYGRPMPATDFRRWLHERRTPIRLLPSA